MIIFKMKIVILMLLLLICLPKGLINFFSKENIVLVVVVV